jgi:hypothetical protein
MTPTLQRLVLESPATALTPGAYAFLIPRTFLSTVQDFIPSSTTTMPLVRLLLEY